MLPGWTADMPPDFKQEGRCYTYKGREGTSFFSVLSKQMSGLLSFVWKNKNKLYFREKGLTQSEETFTQPSNENRTIA
jgi:hypothetical protein